MKQANGSYLSILLPLLETTNGMAAEEKEKIPKEDLVAHFTANFLITPTD